jgi:photosynthetic reaction center cytochrome c subunit
VRSRLLARCLKVIEMKVGLVRILKAGAVCMLLGLLPASGQTPGQQKPLMAEDVFKNVQVLKGIPVNQFMETMGFFSASLGYNCTNCHGGEVLGNWEKYANDTPVKQTARRMVLIVKTINQSLFAGREAVTCYTCHRGSPTPKVVPSLLEQYSEPPADDPNEVELSPRAPATPTADDILNRYIEALGGAQQLAGLTSFVGMGRYDGFDSYHGKVAVEVYAKNTGQRTVIVHTQNGDSVTAYDGRNAWIMGPDKPVSVLQLAAGGDMDGVKLDSDLAFPGGLKQALTELRAGFPTTMIDDREVQVVQAMAGASRVKLFFDKQTGLLTRVVRYSKTIVGPVPTQVDYSDYREVAGVKLPFQWRLTWTDGQSMFSLDDLQPNVAIDPAKFAKPAAAVSPRVAPVAP